MTWVDTGQERWQKIKARGWWRYILIDWIIRRALPWSGVFALSWLLYRLIFSRPTTWVDFLTYWVIALIGCTLLATLAAVISWKQNIGRAKQ